MDHDQDSDKYPPPVYRLLGQVRIVDGRGRTPALRPQWRATLACLLLNANSVVTFERLAGALWGHDAPPTARTQIHAAVSALRRADPGAAVESVAGGYLQRVGPEDLDLFAFRALVARARATTDHDRASDLLRQALDLWQGEALADITSDYAAAVRRQLAEERFQAYERLAEAELACGRHDTLVPLLRRLLAEDPLRERFTAMLMLALYRSGKQAEALACYERLRGRLADELGIDPGSALRDLHLAILRHAPSLDGDRPAARPTPAHLPAAVPGLVGRSGELAELDRSVTAGSTSTLAVVSGSPGVGKSALAVHWAHRVADRFPDGQLYADMRGSSPTGKPVDPAEVLQGFLEALGVPARRLPTTTDARIGLYRSLLRDRKVLILLDDARDAEHVRWLLPAAPQCFTLVTSRRELTGLVAAEGARPLVLDMLTDHDARTLLLSRLGDDRAATDAAALQRIVHRCAGLPIALAIVAARAALRPALSLGELDTKLGQPVRLDWFDGGDPATDLRTLFARSYADLSEGAARLFRLLGLHPGRTFTPTAAAALLGRGPEATGQLLEELVRAHLLTEESRGRFTCHDLLRAYARELCDDPAAERRLLDFYLHSAYAANQRYRPKMGTLHLEPPAEPVPLERFGDRQSALDWLRAEHQALLSVAGRAVALGLDRHARQLGWAVRAYQQHPVHWQAEQRVQAMTGEPTRCSGGDIATKALTRSG
ncbi:transcriptional regulator [Catenulispora subtropica]|uniref:Bacterial transcriptional activator domain-containing protein n=1 Tax=Catenulispora subtropica TaxID=450798 RepID=A0ABP5CIZ4_9ACTN